MDDLISKLSEIRSEYNCFNEDEESYYRALSKAISILSRRMNDDAISRKAAIDAFRKELCRERVYATPFISFKGCERILNELPSAERHGRWIRTGEDGLPEIGDRALVTIPSIGETFVTIGIYAGEYRWHISNYGFCEKVIAWMLLPEPYKEGEEE